MAFSEEYSCTWKHFHHLSPEGTRVARQNEYEIGQVRYRFCKRITKVKFGYVYLLLDPLTDIVRYVGQTVYMRGRWIEHTGGTGATKVWVDELRKRGLVPKLTVARFVCVVHGQYSRFATVKSFIFPLVAIPDQSAIFDHRP